MERCSRRNRHAGPALLSDAGEDPRLCFVERFETGGVLSSAMGLSAALSMSRIRTSPQASDFTASRTGEMRLLIWRQKLLCSCFVSV